MLAAGARTPEHINPQIILINLDFHIFRHLRDDIHGSERKCASSSLRRKVKSVLNDARRLPREDTRKHSPLWMISVAFLMPASSPPSMETSRAWYPLLLRPSRIHSQGAFRPSPGSRHRPPPHSRRKWRLPLSSSESMTRWNSRRSVSCTREESAFSISLRSSDSDVSSIWRSWRSSFCSLSLPLRFSQFRIVFSREARCLSVFCAASGSFQKSASPASLSSLAHSASKLSRSKPPSQFQEARLQQFTFLA